jgi:hypothetical protein
MADRRTIAVGLATLHEAYPTRAITEQTAEVWLRLFEPVPNAAFLAACERVAVQPGRTFFPTPGEVMAVAAPSPVVDTDTLLRAIQGMGEYNPHVGMLPPRVEAVRHRYGDAVADAYAEAGPSRLFADDDRDGSSVTRDIARRAFSGTIAEAVAANPDLPRQIANPMTRPLLGAGADE